MKFIPFRQRYPDIADRETRSVTLFASNEWRLLPGTYGFVESFCIDDTCDCRKVMIAVVLDSAQSEVVATIGYGWESAVFYTEWMYGDEESGAMLSGSYLELGAEQSRYSNAWLNLWEKLILPDEKYRERIRRHYAMFKARP
ncbi:MAG: hypothetical protein AAB947_00410 [Patescibacteria group bacterium]|mgnify:CR=1 FL=1